MQGKLVVFKKDAVHPLPIFLSGEKSRCIFIIGSQNEPLFTTPYVAELAAAGNANWCVAHMVMGSCQTSVESQDHLCEAEDVDEAVAYLHNEHGMSEIALFAIGTGVQVAVQLMGRGNNTNLISHVILHGCVVPKEHPLFTAAANRKREEKVAELLKDGRKNDMAAMQKVYDVPITPGRLRFPGYPTLQEALWQPALTDQSHVCTSAFKPFSVPILFMISTVCSYVPSATERATVKAAVQNAVTGPKEDVHFAYFVGTCDEHRHVLRGKLEEVVKTVFSFLEESQTRILNRRAEEESAAAEEEQQKRVKLAKALCAK